MHCVDFLGLRARKFDVDKVFELLDEAKEHFAKAKDHDFYPDLEKALGFSRPVFLSQYPAVFCGNAKNGCPSVMYLKCGAIQPEGIKALVSLNQLLHLTKKRIRNDNASLVSEISFVGDVEDTPISRTICAVSGPSSFI